MASFSAVERSAQMLSSPEGTTRVQTAGPTVGTYQSSSCSSRNYAVAAYGIMPHSNILLAIGAATLLMNASRICGSPFSNWITFCSCCVGGAFWAFFSHSCSQLEFWYFWMILLATASIRGYWAWATLTYSSPTANANR